MKTTKRFISAVLSVSILLVFCCGFNCYAAPTLKRIEILQEPDKKTFVKGIDWDYGEWYQPSDAPEWKWQSSNRISFLRNGGGGYYPDAGMIDATGLKIRAHYSDGSSKTLTYTETKVSSGYRQNINLSPETGYYEVGKINIAVWLVENNSVYATYQIEMLTKLMGDLTGDGRLSSEDALKVLQYSVGLVTFDANQKSLADMNSDGKINSSDALFILQKAVGLK